LTHCNIVVRLSYLSRIATANIKNLFSKKSQKCYPA
jgi:hypothetical protein